ncbi:hypothetical protein BU52_05995 [Streptomyces toyocaensis]|uniref:Uncharacterized protein n=1 Tax=Streptomyces toyocaensis TaxID=55952 RepID=A0A081XWQ5_STRTO|nr:hypothetical protein [Streptomyces toyocaensis]KES07978.1 hypothetical protein BU52_05995 [Streptomyces toyocaensis]
MTAPSVVTGVETRRVRASGRRWWAGTLWVLLGTPIVLTGCGWIAQRPGFLPTLLSMVVALAVLGTAWVMCGAKAGAGVAVSGFVFLLFVGPTLGDYVIHHRGVRHDALVVDVSDYRGRGGRERPLCTVVLTGADRGRTIELGDTGGCDDGLTVGSHVTLVDDPEGWVAPRLGSEVRGVAPYLPWTLAGLLSGLETCALYGRLRRRVRNVGGAAGDGYPTTRSFG